MLASATAMGAVFGSLLNVALLRLPMRRSLWAPPSRCDVCEAQIAWYDNVPALSWLILRGRCRSCGASIPAFHPVIELLCACLAWLIVRRFVPSERSIDVEHLTAAALYFYFAWCLVLAALSDLRTRIVPEEASLYAIPVGLGGAVLLDVLGYHGWLHVGWRASFLGAGVALVGLGALSLLWRLVLGREGLGWGDVRLVTMIGAFLGAIPGLWCSLLFGSLFGAAAGLVTVLVLRRTLYLPFGPSLAVAALAYLLWGETIVTALFPGMVMFL